MLKEIKYPLRLGLAAIALAACSGESKDQTSSNEQSATPVVTASSIVTPTIVERTRPKIPEIVKQYYPGLEASGINMNEAKVIRTDLSRIPTEVYNFTDYQININAATFPYDAFEFLAADPNYSVEYPIGGKNRILKVEPRLFSNRIVFVVPENAPTPSLLTESVPVVILEPGSSFTLVDTEIPRVVSGFYVTEHRTNQLFRNSKEFLTLVYSVIVCNQVIKVKVLDATGRPVDDFDEQYTAQEGLCTSLGIAVAARMLDKSFVEYQEFTQQRGLSLENYQALKVTGTIIH